MTTKLAFALAFCTGIAAFAPPAGAVNLNPNGLGQVLIYPYYTVNAGQQTLLSVVNTSLAGRVVKVRFREAYNGRSVLDFNLYLSPYDVWTADVFALSDAGLGGDFAAIFTTDHSCTDPALTASGKLGNGSGYLRFANDKYTGAAADTGPATDTRTREGYFEMILMSDVTNASPLYNDIRHVNGTPSVCASAKLESAIGYAAPTSDPATGGTGTLADGGLFGSAAIINVAEGVFYAYNADALDGFSYTSLYTLPGDPLPTLASVNDRGNAQAATSRVFASGESFTSPFPGTTSGSRAVDAVSSVFAANNLYNEYVTSTNGSIDTDWVLTFPTKHLYVDAQPGGAIAGAAVAYAPFEQLFGAIDGGKSCVATNPDGVMTMDREENTTTPETCGFSGCPPQPPAPGLCLQTNVLGFSTTSVLGSQLPTQTDAFARFAANGWVNWDLAQSTRQLYPASNGNIFHGLPVTGFAATRFVNSFLPIPGGGFALSNYSGAYHHRATTACTNGSGDACK